MPKTTNIVLTLKAKCAAIGTNITQICKDAGVPRQTVERWKVEEPKTIVLLRKIEEAIEERARKHGNVRKVGAIHKAIA